MSTPELKAMAAEMRRLVADDVSAWEADMIANRRTYGDQDTRVYGESSIVRALTVVTRSRLTSGGAVPTPDEEEWLIGTVRSAMFGQGVLDSLLADPDTENIVANGCNNVTITKTGGRRVAGPPLADSDADLEEMIRRLAASVGRTERRFDDAHPFLDLRLPDGSRLHAIKGVTSRLCVSIRKHRHLTVTLAELVRLGTMSEALAHVLSAAIRPPLPCSVLIAGGTDTGKTTFARGLISEIPSYERLIVVEDNAELGLEFDPARAPYVVEMEVRQANLEGAGEIGMRELGRQALRMRPDRLIIGECRSGYEVRTMLEAMNSGHEGSLTTIHADSSLSALTKMQTLALTGEDALDMEASAHLVSLVLHLVVHLTKLPDGRRVVSSLREVTGAHDDQIITTEVFAPGPDGQAQPTEAGFSSRLLERLTASGLDRTRLVGAIR